MAQLNSGLYTDIYCMYSWQVTALTWHCIFREFGRKQADTTSPKTSVDNLVKQHTQWCNKCVWNHLLGQAWASPTQTTSMAPASTVYMYTCTVHKCCMSHHIMSICEYENVCCLLMFQIFAAESFKWPVHWTKQRQQYNLVHYQWCVLQNSSMVHPQCLTFV